MEEEFLEGKTIVGVPGYNHELGITLLFGDGTKIKIEPVLDLGDPFLQFDMVSAPALWRVR